MMGEIKNIFCQQYVKVLLLGVFVIGGVIGFLLQFATVSYAKSGQANGEIGSMIEKSKKDYNIELSGVVNFIDKKEKKGKISVEGGSQYKFDMNKDLADGEPIPMIGQTVKFNVKHLKSKDVTNVRIINAEPVGPFSMTINIDTSHTINWSLDNSVVSGIISYVNGIGLQTYDISGMLPSGTLTINSTDVALDGCYILKTFDAFGNSVTYGVCSSL